MDNPHSKKKRAIERIAMFSSCHHRIDEVFLDAACSSWMGNCLGGLCMRAITEHLFVQKHVSSMTTPGRRWRVLTLSSSL